MRILKTVGLTAALAIGLGTGAAQAATTTYTNGSLTVIEGNPQPKETFIFLPGGTNTTSENGNVGSQTGTSLINFLTTTPVDFAQGFATITTCNSCKPAPLIGSVTLTSPTGLKWNDVLFGALGPSGSGASQLTMTAYLGTTVLGTVAIADIGSGLDALLTEISVAGLMDKLVLTSSTGLVQFKQFEISGSGISNVPLPPAAILFGTALVGMGILGRRRRKDGIAQA
jgi:hypothetical protein